MAKPKTEAFFIKKASDHCKKMDWTFDKSTHFNFFAKRTIDLFGFADLVVLRPPRMMELHGLPGTEPFPWPCSGSIVAVQVTSGSNHAARRTKILAEPRAKMWHDCGGVVEVWSYTKRKTGRYEMRVEEVSFDADV